MSNDIKVSASILSADFTRLGDEIKKCEDAGVDMIHIDVMDGHFAPNISIGLPIVEAVRGITKLPIDTHLMIENPGSYLEAFVDAGSNFVSVHAECYGERRSGCQKYGEFPKEVDSLDEEKLIKDLNKIKNKGAQAWVVFNLGTPVCLGKAHEYIDGALFMSVNPGFSGQKFNSDALPKIKALRDSFKGDISIDGGVSAQTAPAAVEAGVNVLATASYFFGADDPKAAVDYLKNL
ncbi:MAG: ribulose-phosphate 3-epimerase [Lysobacterales bacterium]|jgi:ribulose-phosphate 3-epimerase